MMMQEREDHGEKYLSVETEDDFHEALKRGHLVEVPPELAKKIGLSFEDVGTLEEIIDAAEDPYA